VKKPITLVILPGLDGTEVLFRPLLALLPDWIQPVVICYPASGPNEYADLLEIVREKIAGLPSLIVLASSFSGPLFIMLAAAEPDRMRGLILSATFLRAPGRHLPSLRLIACGPIIWIMRTARRIPI
jgi:pimeloyl-[acyl-carrier protein] methyl ester esterase